MVPANTGVPPGRSAFRSIGRSIIDLATTWLHRHDAFKFADQCGDIFSHDLPDYIQIDFEVSMHDPVSKTDNVGPWYVGVRVSGVLAYAGRGFPDNLQDLETAF